MLLRLELSRREEWPSGRSSRLSNGKWLRSGGLSKGSSRGEGLSSMWVGVINSFDWEFSVEPLISPLV